MAKVERILHGDLGEISRKIDAGMVATCPMTTKRDEWTTEAGSVRCILKVFEKHSGKLDMPHMGMAVNLVDTGEEIRLCAITSGSSRAYFFNPYDGAEGELTAALNTTLNILDQII